MKKVLLNGMQMLTKKQMKKIRGGEDQKCCYVITECDSVNDPDAVYGHAELVANNCHDLSNSQLDAACRTLWTISQSDGSCSCVGGAC